MQNNFKPTATSHNPRYAGFWIRFLATIIDTVCLLAITLPILVAIYGKQYFYANHLIQGRYDFILNWVLPIVAVLIFWQFKSATPGKMLCHIKIIDATTGEKPTFLQYMIRYIAYYISAIPLFLGFLWVAIDPRKQGWHDKIAGTVVIYGE